MAGNGRVKEDGQSAFFYAIEEVRRATDPKDFETALKIFQELIRLETYKIIENLQRTDKEGRETDDRSRDEW